MNVSPTIGVLAMQGAFAAHAEAFSDLGIAAVEVRTVEQLQSVDALVLPGGESTAMSKLLVTFGLIDPLTARIADGLPVFGTCAGMILLASRILDGRPDQRCLSALPIEVRRNGYGRQIDSFEADLVIDGMEAPPFHVVFIRAPIVERYSAEVDVLASVDGKAVLCRYRNSLVASFHPELTPDRRLHQYFVDTFVKGS